MSSPTPTTSARSYLDFQGLASLRGQAARDPDKAIRATAEQFEAHFIQQMMKAMRDTVEKSELVDNDHADMYQDLMDKEVALQMVRRGGMGLADMLEKQMLLQQSQAVAANGPAPALQPLGAKPAMLPLHPPGPALPLQPKVPAGLPIERTGAFELHRRSGGQP